MAIQPPADVAKALADFDARSDMFEIVHVGSALKKPATESDSDWRGWWAEWAAFNLDTHPAQDGGPWKTYFQPAATWVSGDQMQCSPDLQKADAEVIEYWKTRSHTAKHPVLVARYADLVWDTEKFATGKRPDIRFDLPPNHVPAATRVRFMVSACP